MYAKFFKRFFDFSLSLLALIILSPLLLLITIAGAFAMRGNPFFVQERPGKIDKNGSEKIFTLIKFRTMSNKTDGDGNPLPDEERLTAYGRFLRSTSLDELPELVNILKGDMAIVGPRPLLVRYLPYYTPEQRRRHTVRPGLTGYSQVHGRNAVDWEERFRLDTEYADGITLTIDVKILFLTVLKVLRRDGISGEGSETMKEFTGAKPEGALPETLKSPTVKL